MDSGIVINNWGMDWAWGLPLIVLTVVIHAYGLGIIVSQAAFDYFRRLWRLNWIVLR